MGKPRALLALLLLNAGDVVSTDVIEEALWPERPPASAANALQQYVAQLRRSLGRDAVTTRAPGYVLPADDDRIDVRRLDRLVWMGRDALARARPAEAATHLAAALALFRGVPLADFRYEPFAQAEAARLEELRLAVAEERIEAELALGRHSRFVGDLQALVAAHPLRERARALLMRALYGAGRQADALSVFQDARRRLVDELGVEPGPELQNLHGAILRQDPVLGTAHGASGVSAPPVPPTPLLGREAELARLQRLLGDGEARAVTITGPGGVGKTRLALEAAHVLAGAFDEVAFAELAALRDPGLVPSAVAGALGAAGDLAAHLDGRRVLLVADNLEQVVDGAGALAELLAACPGLALLATSRERLRVRGEIEIGLAPLADAPAVELFRARAAAVNARLDASDDEIAALCRRLDGLPLAIELASARARLLSPGDLLDRLDRSLPLLVDGPRDAPERHRALRATIAWSYDLLSGEERALFEDLAVFAGAFSPSDIEAVCGGRLGTLASLLDKSLVTARDQAGLALLATVREFALERLEARPDADELRRRHAEHVAAEVERADELLTGPEQARALAEIAARQDDVRAALDWAIGRSHATLALRLVAATGWFWFVRGLLGEGRRWLESAVALGGEAADEHRGTAFMRLGALAFEQGDLDAARRAYERALELRRSVGDDAGSAGALVNLGNVALDAGDYDEARRAYDASLELARERGDARGTAVALLNLANAHRAARLPGRAAELAEQSLGLAVGLGDRWGEAICRASLAGALVELGETRRAAELLAESVRLRRELDEPAGTAAALGELALLALRLSDPGAAARRLGAAAAIRAALGSTLGRPDRERLERLESEARAALGAALYEREWAAGRALDPEGALALAEEAAGLITGPVAQ